MSEEQTAVAGRVAIVTGASRGIGLAIAARLVKLGCQVVITGRDQQRLHNALQSVAPSPGRCDAVVCDVAELASVERLAEHVRKTYGRVHVLVNNAGIAGPPVPAYELPPEQWDAIFNINLRGVFYMMRAFVPPMIETGGGDIINISSLAGKNPLPRGAAYAASKWGLNGFTYSVAEELRQHNIRVSVICPGSVDTGFSHSNKDPNKKLQPEDVAHAVEMLLRQRAGSFMSEVLLRPTQKP